MGGKRGGKGKIKQCNRKRMCRTGHNKWGLEQVRV
jgi:hypothetical protein